MIKCFQLYTPNPAQLFTATRCIARYVQNIFGWKSARGIRIREYATKRTRCLYTRLKYANKYFNTTNYITELIPKCFLHRHLENMSLHSNYGIQNRRRSTYCARSARMRRLREENVLINNYLMSKRPQQRTSSDNQKDFPKITLDTKYTKQFLEAQKNKISNAFHLSTAKTPKTLNYDRESLDCANCMPELMDTNSHRKRLHVDVAWCKRQNTIKDRINHQTMSENLLKVQSDCLDQHHLKKTQFTGHKFKPKCNESKDIEQLQLPSRGHISALARIAEQTKKLETARRFVPGVQTDAALGFTGYVNKTNLPTTKRNAQNTAKEMKASMRQSATLVTESQSAAENNSTMQMKDDNKESFLARAILRMENNVKRSNQCNHRLKTPKHWSGS